MDPSQGCITNSLVFCGEVERLPTHHALKPHGDTDDLEYFEALFCTECLNFSDSLKRGGLQPVTSENRRGFVERAVKGGLTAPEIIVIHRREVVVHQRVRMQKFDRLARHDGRGDRFSRNEFCASQSESTSELFAGVL
jgi:hypothetical protein